MAIGRVVPIGLFAAIALASAQAMARDYTGLYVFGDSYSDQGNLLVATTQLQASTGQPAQPASDHYFFGRFSNGLIYSDVLAFSLLVPLHPSLRGGGNFAFGGAATDSNTDEVPPYGTGPYAHNAYPWSLDLEREAFLTRFSTTGADPNALYVVFSGSNDVAGILQQGSNPQTTITATVTGIIQTIETIKALGGKTVLVPNVPDEGLLPVVTSLQSVVPGISAIATQVTAQYNAALAQALSQESGITIIPFDTFHLLQAVAAHPAQYGFTNATQPCYSGTVTPDPSATVCADPAQHVFWDSEHFTSAFHILFGGEILRTLSADRQN